MQDIVPELWKDIEQSFREQVENDKQIQAVLSGQNKKATFSDVSEMGRRLGVFAAKSLIEYLTPNNLPDGRPYWNILERTVMPLMREVYELVNRLAVAVQTVQDEKQNIHLKPQKAPFPRERVETIMNKIMAIYEGAAADE